MFGKKVGVLEHCPRMRGGGPLLCLQKDVRFLEGGKPTRPLLLPCAVKGALGPCKRKTSRKDRRSAERLLPKTPLYKENGHGATEPLLQIPVREIFVLPLPNTSERKLTSPATAEAERRALTMQQRNIPQRSLCHQALTTTLDIGYLSF